MMIQKLMNLLVCLLIFCSAQASDVHREGIFLDDVPASNFQDIPLMTMPAVTSQVTTSHTGLISGVDKDEGRFLRIAVGGSDLAVNLVTFGGAMLNMLDGPLPRFEYALPILACSGLIFRYVSRMVLLGHNRKSVCMRTSCALLDTTSMLCSLLFSFLMFGDRVTPANFQGLAIGMCGLTGVNLFTSIFQLAQLGESRLPDVAEQLKRDRSQPL